MATAAYVAERTALGEAIYRLRTRAGLSQSYLARVAGVERSYISMLEHGERKNASEAVLRNIARALGLSTAELYREAALHWSERESPDAANVVVADDPAQAQVLRRLRALFSVERLIKLERIGRIISLEGQPPHEDAEREAERPAGPDEPEPHPDTPA
jgi:transcriptional regulator with XRE-family HTH domain